MNDTFGGSGVQTVFMWGVDANFDFISESLNLDGLTPVVTANTYLRLHRMLVTVGQTVIAPTHGIITASAPIAGSDLGIIGARSGGTHTGLFSVPNGFVVAVGEMSGNLEESLTKIADAYDDEIETTARALTALIEPAILLIMGAVVGFIVLAMLLPIFEINQII